MIYTIVVVLLILWVLGLVTSYTLGGLLHDRQVLLVHQPHLVDRAADHLRGGPPEEALGALGPAREAEVRVPLDDRERRVVGVELQVAVGDAQRLVAGRRCFRRRRPTRSGNSGQAGSIRRCNPATTPRAR